MTNVELRRALQVAMCQLPITGRYRRANGVLIYERAVIGQNSDGRYDLLETTTKLEADFPQSILKVTQDNAQTQGSEVRGASILDGREVLKTVGFGEPLSEVEQIAAAIELLSGCSHFDRTFVVTGAARNGW